MVIQKSSYIKESIEGKNKRILWLVTALVYKSKSTDKIILIWDRASIHLSKITIAYLHKHPEILIEELPAYAPDLNLEEYRHGNVKQHLENAHPTSKEEILSMLDRGFAHLRHQSDFLPGFFHAAGLTVRQLR